MDGFGWFWHDQSDNTRKTHQSGNSPVINETGMHFEGKMRIQFKDYGEITNENKLKFDIRAIDPMLSII